MLSIYIVSDSLGETAEQVAKAALSQFLMPAYEIKRFPYVLTDALLEDILQGACQEESALVFHTLVSPRLNARLKEFEKSSGIDCVDVLTPSMEALSEKTGLTPLDEPGAIRRLNEEYFKRVEAIEFAVKYDDGKEPRGLLKADCVILGISRTSKTPLSMYLANKHVKVANIPLVPESSPPPELYEVSPKRVIGLTNSPQKLNEIREERLKALGLPKGSSYSSMERILEEIDYAEKIMKKIGCPIINVANKAIEETAEIIIKHLKKTGVHIVKE